MEGILFLSGSGASACASDSGQRERVRRPRWRRVHSGGRGAHSHVPPISPDKGKERRVQTCFAGKRFSELSCLVRGTLDIPSCYYGYFRSSGPLRWLFQWHRVVVSSPLKLDGPFSIRCAENGCAEASGKPDKLWTALESLRGVSWQMDGFVSFCAQLVKN